MASLIIGGGVTGLAAGFACGYDVLEAADGPGGLCRSYYMRGGANRRGAVTDGAYRFELGGGHWIFGGDESVVASIHSLSPTRRYLRQSSVYFHVRQRYVPFPIQEHLSELGGDVSAAVLSELARAHTDGSTMKEWFRGAFGPTLCSIFFDPFHERYTAGLYDRIAPQDAYKSPAAFYKALRGALSAGGEARSGYNVSFRYPTLGLDHLTTRLAERGAVRYGQHVTAIGTDAREVQLQDGRVMPYDRLLTTLPLSDTLDLCGIELACRQDPYTSVLIVNIGATRGERCPRDHWVYTPDSRSLFHRVGFYSNVDPSFVPAGQSESAVAIYVERAYLPDARPTPAEEEQYVEAVLRELQDWEYIGVPEVVDTNWIDVAYTWQWPGSAWRREAMEALLAQRVVSTGRYGKWTFQGIAESLKDGFSAGAALRLLSSS